MRFYFPFFLSFLVFSKASFAKTGPVVGETFVLEHSQFPEWAKKNNASKVYVLYEGSPYRKTLNTSFNRKDTITDLQKFIDSTGEGVIGFRAIFESKGKMDSLWEKNMARIVYKVYNIGSGKFRVVFLDDDMKAINEYTSDYAQALTEQKKQVPPLAVFLREYRIILKVEKRELAQKRRVVWMLSIGIDNYGDIRLSTCQSDAKLYSDFFKNEYRLASQEGGDTLYRSYLLLGKSATRDSIIYALKDISKKASPDDYFIFNFSGGSNVTTTDSINYTTNFFPYDIVYKGTKLENRFPKDTTNPVKNLLPLGILQEYIQQIPANNQLFISEAGPSNKFKTEFVKTLMNNSPAVASILNKNRIIIVPNKIGYDNTSCSSDKFEKGPITHFITTLDSNYNIYDIFREDGRSEEIAFKLKSGAYNCSSNYINYFDVFFEKQFLKQYREIFGEGEGASRGLKVKSKEVQETVNSLTGNHYALIVGTDNYRNNGWSKLSNPVKDARAVAEVLSGSYGFEVELMENKPIDSIYQAIRKYYRIAKPNDQFIVYFAGHGDADDELLDDGFIVCTDSRSIEDDPLRNSYIPYSKLQKILNNIPARQVLVLLDVCHGGTFDALAFNKEKRVGEFTTSNVNVLQFLKDKLPLRTRKFLSSVGSEAAFDGKAGSHSPFVNLLLQVLRTKGSGTNGIITLTDINAVLKTASLNETATLKISPHMADFGNVDAFSEFILIPVEKTTSKE